MLKLKRQNRTPTISQAVAAGVAPAVQSSKRIGKKKLLIVFSVVVILLVIAAAIGLILQDSKQDKFKTITYSNGKGEKYRLQFYTNSSLRNYQDIFENTGIEKTNSNISNLKQMVSNYSVNGKAPVVLYINAYPSNAGTIENEKACGNYKLVFNVSNKPMNKLITVCNFEVKSSREPHDHPDARYTAEFIYKNKIHKLTMQQDLHFNSKNAKEEEKKLGLDTYKEDIRNIIASLDPQY